MTDKQRPTPETDSFIHALIDRLQALGPIDYDALDEVRRELLHHSHILERQRDEAREQLAGVHGYACAGESAAETCARLKKAADTFEEQLARYRRIESEAGATLGDTLDECEKRMEVEEQLARAHAALRDADQADWYEAFAQEDWRVEHAQALTESTGGQ